MEDLYDIPSSYAEDGRPDFYLEVLLGDESFIETNQEGRFDYWADQRERELERRERDARLDDEPVGKGRRGPRGHPDPEFPGPQDLRHLERKACRHDLREGEGGLRRQR
jgi:hypothetical protein